MRSRHGERGSVVAEFALASLASIWLTLGIIEVGRAVYTYHLVSNGARLGSRYGIVRGSAVNSACQGAAPSTAAAVSSYVKSMSPGLDTTQLAVNTTCGSAGCSSVTNATNGPGCPVSVQVSYNFKFLLPFMPSPTMSSTSTMVISQ